ncbi:DUF1702 family protein [Actinoplanes sp. LDG1-06]|uniref:DUF1702 family protein n=1 Tax=Paractinoplanes ovalisporus TaxID=2810368 RepID=A0ABS2AJT2_9ACTN|nr:DUF1702 family protein [Actinoplanes ovalisporus]MBM2620115.1 DUF1702 family protein [Actinoplanes ovalisporus]
MGTWGSLRRRVLTPAIRETSMAVRGFHVKSAEGRELLETIGASFLQGYGAAAEAREPGDAEFELESVPVRFRGFAYEGAAMGFGVRDGLPVGGGGRVQGFLAGRGDRHIYMAYVGVGWAMARLPRFRWRTLHAPDPLLRWLALDGYGFHQAYFRTQRYVHEQFREARFPYPDPDPAGYAARAIDQGIGRALWFVGGTDVERVTELAAAYAPERRSDLYGGIGLAATYAGGADGHELAELLRRAGRHASDLAQGSAFAASARTRAGLVVPHVDLGTRVLCGLSAAQAAEVCDRTRPREGTPGGLPAYERWRQAVRRELAPAERH